MKRLIFLTISSCLFLMGALAQTIQVPFDNKAWDLSKAETKLETYMGKPGISLAKGSISLPEVKFLNGTLEVDINFPAGRNFPGLFFRAQDEQNNEHFYIRPHQSGNPDACQYTPTFNGYAGWQLYYGEGFGAPIPLVPDQWHHLKIEVKGSAAQIFFDDMNSPILDIKVLKGNFPAGSIGLVSGNPVYFANFAYRLDPTTYPVQAETMSSDPNQITSWQLSQVLDNQRFAGKTQLEAADRAGLTWKAYPTEANGLMNLARYIAPAEGKTTVIAKLVIPSDKNQIKGLTFGYSDQVLVYVNGKLQYAGQNNFQSRDYRYLGTIGYFDAVFLDLKAGDNEVWFVVTENFGGWGVQAKWL